MSDPPPPASTIALVGHCGFDSASLRRWVGTTLPDADLVAVNRQAELDQHAHGQALLLINRVLDGRFDAGSSLDMIRGLAGGDDPPRTMLISNYEDAQADARAAGAYPGVGKSDLGTPAAAKRLRHAATSAAPVADA